MENEMKALAEGLALFLTPDITLSGIFKDGFPLFKFADRFDFTLPERNTAQRDNGKAVFEDALRMLKDAANEERLQSEPLSADALLELLKRKRETEPH